MNNDNEMTAEERANAVGQVAGALMDTMRDQGLHYPGMAWTDMIYAASVACRGVAGLAMAADPELTLDQARARMTRLFIDVMCLPAELVRTVAPADGEKGEVIVMPVRRHS